MSEIPRCPHCQAEIPAGAPEGLCPQCLLQAGLALNTGEAEPKTATYSPRGTSFVPPTPEALQAAFPQLEILELLGKGGMGAVYKARQPALERLVAVKILPPEVSQDAAFAERFTREARALAKLNHPNIVAIYDFGQAGAFCYFLMEYVDGVNLRQAMQAGVLKAAEALKIVPQICEALQFAHDEGIVHRDIKPENILLDKKGRVKIADFGLAKLLGKTAPDVSLTGTRQVMGTLHYMAPEQLEGAHDIDHRADIYSLGVTFYELLTGELPLGRFVAPSKKVQIDVRLDEVVLHALERKPEQRYQQASEIKTEMETIARGPAVPPSSQPSGPAPQASYLRLVVFPTSALFGCYCLVNLSITGLGLLLPEGRVASVLRQEVGAFVLIGGGFLLAVIFLILNGVWLSRKLTAMNATAALSGTPPLHKGSYVRSVVLPILALGVLLLIAAGVCLGAFRPRNGLIYSLGDPGELAKIGATLTGLAFLILNGVWLYRTRPAGGAFRTVSHTASWTLVCVALLVIFWTPVDRNASGLPYSLENPGYLDYWYWPYKGVSESSVSLTPTVPIYQRLVIREEALANRLGYQGGSFRLYNRPSGLIALIYTLELEPVADAKRGPATDKKNQLIVDVLNGMSWRYTTENGGQRSGAVLDTSVVAEWLRKTPLGLQVTEEQIDTHARALVDIILAAARENGGTPISPNTNQLVSRLHHAVAMYQNSYRSVSPGPPPAFRTFTAADNMKWEPEVPILVVGVPLMLAVWGIGLWLLWRRRRVTA